MKRNSGLTAFELAVMLAILACIAAFVMPPYLKWLRAYRIREAAVTLKVDIEMAKTRAICENEFVVVEFAAGNYVIFVDDGDGALRAFVEYFFAAVDTPAACGPTRERLEAPPLCSDRFWPGTCSTL